MVIVRLPPLIAGVYRHYKGHLYLVLGYAGDANDEDRAVVVYVGLDLVDAQSQLRMKVRTAEDFFAIVDPKTGEAVEVDAPGSVPRFTFVGPFVPAHELK